MGRLLAVTLAQAGCEVELFEAGGPEAEGAAARVAAAMLAPLRNPPSHRLRWCAWVITRSTAGRH